VPQIGGCPTIARPCRCASRRAMEIRCHTGIEFVTLVLTQTPSPPIMQLPS